MSEDIFERIISNRYWRDHPCGTGSLLKETENLRHRLPVVCNQLGIESIFDAPCGDYSWINTVEWLSPIHYTGADIVSKMIDENREKYPSVNFVHFDIVNDELPDVDLFFCRDCLIHLPWSDIKKTLINFAQSKCRYIATTSYDDEWTNNRDITVGDFREINLMQDPANLPEPVVVINDSGTQKVQRYMMFWDKQQVKLALKNWKES